MCDAMAQVIDEQDIVVRMCLSGSHTGEPVLRRELVALLSHLYDRKYVSYAGISLGLNTTARGTRSVILHALFRRKCS